MSFAARLADEWILIFLFAINCGSVSRNHFELYS